MDLRFQVSLRPIFPSRRVTIYEEDKFYASLMICDLIVFSNWYCLSWSFKSGVIPPSPMVLLQCVPTLVQCCCGWQLVQAKCKVAMVHNSCTIGGFQLVQDAGGCRVQGSQDQSAAEVKEPKYIGAAAASTVLQFFSNNMRSLQRQKGQYFWPHVVPAGYPDLGKYCQWCKWDQNYPWLKILALLMI